MNTLEKSIAADGVRTVPTGQSLLAKARQLRPLFDEMGPANEAKGALCEEVVKALHDGGFFGIFVPKCLGGAEASPVEGLEVFEEVAYADGSTGWVLMAAALSTGTAGAYLEDAIVEPMFAGRRFPVVAGQGAPNGRAIADGDEFTLTGRWNYGSGVKHADYLHNGALIFEADGSPRPGKDGQQEQRIFVAPRKLFELEGNWDVMGLRATGSVDYSTSKARVRAASTHIKECTEPTRGGPFFTLGIKGIGTICHSGFTLGVGRRILDELALLAQTKPLRGGKLGESESFLEKFASAEAKLLAARAWAFAIWEEIGKTLDAGKPLTTRQGTQLRLSLNHIVWTIADISSFAYYAGGGVTLRQSTLQRCFRDIHGATQHATAAIPTLLECGRELSGMARGKVWGYAGLENPG